MANKPATKMRGTRAKLGKRRIKDCCRALASTLSSLDEIDAVFVAIDEDGVCHVYSVVDQHRPEIAEKIIPSEDKIQSLFLNVLFNFRIGAAQGRPPSQAVPIHSQPVFIR
jgi:hypothetical protein